MDCLGQPGSGIVLGRIIFGGKPRAADVFAYQRLVAYQEPWAPENQLTTDLFGWWFML